MAAVPPKMPGGPLATRPLHFIWVLDCSESMLHLGKIQELNYAIRNVIPFMRREADDNPNAQVLVRALKFSDGAQWHVPKPTPISEFTWQDIEASGQTQMGVAFRMLADQLKMPPMEQRALPPVIVLVSDGVPTDDAGTGLKVLMEQQWSKRAIRLAVAIGRRADMRVLQKFINGDGGQGSGNQGSGNQDSEIKPLRADNAHSLIQYIRWCSTSIRAASAPVAQPLKGTPGASTSPMLLPPDLTTAGAPTDSVW